MTGPKLFVTLDALDPQALAPFWAAALGREIGKAGIGWLIMEGPGFGLALQPVADRKVAKNRAHIDLHVDDLDGEVERMVGLGATKVGEPLAQGPVQWQVLNDPEGNELCVCCSPEGAGVAGLVLDCADPSALAPFWAAALGYQILGEFGPYAVLRGQAGQPQLLLQRVDDPKVAKNRLHLDLMVPKLDAAVAQLSALGATPATGPGFDAHPDRTRVLLDPQGNELCVCLDG